MRWTYEKPNEYVVIRFVFYVKKSFAGRVIHKLFGHEPLFANLFYHVSQSYVTSIFYPTNEEREKQTQK